jgi:hypothetical protein
MNKYEAGFKLAGLRQDAFDKLVLAYAAYRKLADNLPDGESKEIALRTAKKVLDCGDECLVEGSNKEFFRLPVHIVNISEDERISAITTINSRRPKRENIYTDLK